MIKCADCKYYKPFPPSDRPMRPLGMCGIKLPKWVMDQLEVSLSSDICVCSDDGCDFGQERKVEP